MPRPNASFAQPSAWNEGGAGGLAGWLALLLVLPIRVYRALVSPLLGPHCRFDPSCSRYAETALVRHGVIRGGRLSVARILRCHPWNPGGHDPVP